MKNVLPLRIPFYIGLSLLFMSMLFRVQHWPGHIIMFWIGFGCHAVFFLMLFAEVLFSKKAGSALKIIWSFLYAAILVFCFFVFPEFGFIAFSGLGFIYLLFGRSNFLYTKKDLEQIKFDSL